MQVSQVVFEWGGSGVTLVSGSQRAVRGPEDNITLKVNLLFILLCKSPSHINKSE